jgi:prevent-host-death family protein
MITKTSAEAQNNFGQLLDTVQREPVVITRHGRPAAYVISPREMEPILRDQARREKAVAEFDALTEQGIPEISDEEINSIVHEVRAERAAR